MRYAKPFFDLQLRFAHKVGALAGLPLARALLEYTNLYIRLGLGHGFDHMKRALARPGRVVGVSWLYNLEAYRRLFPPSYVATAQVIGKRYQHMPLWGQFLDRHGKIRGGTAREFLDRLDRQSSLDGLEQCFPLQVLRVEAPLSEFYEFYGI